MSEIVAHGIAPAISAIRVTFLENVLERNGVPASFRAPPNKVELHEAEKRRAVAEKSLKEISKIRLTDRSEKIECAPRRERHDCRSESFE